MQRRHSHRSHLDCQGRAESPSRCLVSWPSRQLLKFYRNSSQLCRMPLLSTYITRIIRATGWQQDVLDALRKIHVERSCQWWAKLGRELPCMFDERALVRSQAQEQGRRLHDEENDIDGKLTQVNVSSCTEKLFLSHYHNQLAPSCTSVGCRRGYWRWKHLLYCNPKNANLK